MSSNDDDNRPATRSSSTSSIVSVVEEEPPHEFYASLWSTTQQEQQQRRRRRRPTTTDPRATRAAPCTTSTQRPRTVRFRRRNVCQERSTWSARTIPPYYTDHDQHDESHKRRNHPISSSLCSVFRRALSAENETPQFYSILSPTAATSKGFALLSRMGWKESEGGLGRHRNGTLVPVRAVHKVDQKGLGYSNNANGIQRQQPTALAQNGRIKKKETRGQRKRRRALQQEQEAFREKRVRMLLRGDVSEQHEQLYLQLHASTRPAADTRKQESL